MCLKEDIVIFFKIVFFLIFFFLINCAESSKEKKDIIPSDVEDNKIIDKISDLKEEDVASPDIKEDKIDDVKKEDLQMQDFVDVISDVEDGMDLEEVQEPKKGFPSHEMFIKIISPSGDHAVALLGSMTSIKGILFGDPDEIKWESDDGKSGKIEIAPFWTTDIITLKQGDNLIKITAKKGDKKATDYIKIVYNPAFLFGELPKMKPRSLFVGDTTNVVATISLGYYQNFDPATVTLLEVGEGGSLKEIGKMKDDGVVATSGDEIKGDGIWTIKLNISCQKEGILKYRVGLTVKTMISTYTAYSAEGAIECVPHILPSECQNILDMQKSAKDLYLTKLKSEGEKSALAAVYNYFKQNPSVAEAGFDEDGKSVWIYYKSGILGALSFQPEGNRGGYGGGGKFASISSPLGNVVDIASKDVLLLSPYNKEFGKNDENLTISNFLKSKTCPSYNLKGPYLNEQANNEKFREMYKNGIISITSHGNTFFRELTDDIKNKFGWDHKDSQEVIFTGEPVLCSNFLQSIKTCSGKGSCPSGTECVITQAKGTSISGICVDHNQIDLRRGRVVIGDGVYGILPSFVSFHALEKFPETLVYLGTCRSLYNGTMTGAFFAAGAKTIAGYSKDITSLFAYSIGTQFFEKMVNKNSLSGQAIPEINEDPANPESYFLIFGAQNLSISNADIINQDFERGNLLGWSSEGDARVVSKFCLDKPVRGKFMAVISSGLGYTIQTGLFEQKFCIPQGINKFEFYWRFYSEEFHEWCGSIYQDTFTAKFSKETGELTVVDVAIDDLCNPEDCGGCCSKEKCVGLIPSTCQFDQGDTHVVPKWQKAEVDVSGLAGGEPVSLSFFCTDKGDSIYDTVILIDALKFK